MNLRTRILRPRIVLLSVVAISLLAACNKKAADDAATASPKPKASASAAATPAEDVPAATGMVVLAGVDLGTAIGPDQRISEPSASFAPTDAVQVSVLLNGQEAADALRAQVSAKVLDTKGQAVLQAQREVDVSGNAVTAFAFKPDGAWMPGRYVAEVAVGGGEPQRREFDVE